MAIEQNSTITVGSGSDARTFGISKSLNNYTIDELLGIGEWAYSAYNDDEMNANVYSDINTSGTMIDIADGQYASRVVCYPDNQLMSKGYNTNSEGVFFRNVLIYYDVTETNWVSSSVNVDAGRFPHYYVVTDIDLQDLVINALSDPNAVAPSYTTMKLGVNDVTIAPFQLYLDQNGELSLNMLLPPVGGRSSTINSNSDLVCYSVSYGNWSVYTASGGGGRNIKDQMPFHFFNPNHVDYPFQNSRIPGTQVLTDADKLIQCVKTDAPDTPARFHFQYKVELMDKPYIDSARCGIRFKINDTLYKPIVENGMITGYTDDDTVQSEWDEWQTIKDHVTPDHRPEPVPPGPDYDDDPWSGVSFSGVGVGGAGAFAKCYYMTSTELANLRSWMNSNNVPEGFDPMQQIIGLSQVPVSLSGDDNTTVQFVNSSAVYDPGVTRVVDSGVNTQISMGTPKKYSLGSVDIVRRMQERGEPYLDYDCQIELYLPLIGMFSLDTQAVMGRTITAEAILDPISGTLAAYAYVAKDGQNLPIAYGSTTIGVDLPISAQQYSVSRAALKQANAQLGASILSSTLSFIAAATAGGKGSGTGAKTATGTNNGLAAAGIREAGADYMKASQVGNIFGDFMNWGRTVRQLSYGNNTAIAGSFGGSTAQWAYPFTPYVKIIRPRYEKPANYNHSQGVPCVQTKTIGSCTGFIQCLGVDVSGISGATDLELQAIQAALSNGIYAGGSQS